jgi:LacI family transcriptional regulator
MNDSALNFKKVLNIGVRLPDWATHTLPTFRGILSYMRDHDLHWQLTTSISSGHELKPVTIDASWRGDGLIVFRPEQHEIKAWKKAGIPVVNLSSEAADLTPISVLPDNIQMGQLAAEHLMTLGLKNYAYFGNTNRSYSNERQEGFKMRLNDHGHSLQEMNLPPYLASSQQDRWRQIQKNIKPHLQELEFPVGILARDDILALSILHAAKDLKIRIPDQIALVGIGNSIPHCQVAWPPLTSVSYPAQNIGCEAARTLHQMLQGHPPESATILKSTGLVKRESSQMIVTTDEKIAQAVQLIQQHAGLKNINVKELSQDLGLSYSSFRQRFRQAMGYSAKEAITKVRIAKAQELLIDSSMSIQEISWNMNFSSPEEFSRFFTRQAKVAPSHYRANHR